MRGIGAAQSIGLALPAQPRLAFPRDQSPYRKGLLDSVEISPSGSQSEKVRRYPMTTVINPER